jgi:hypothetical protein
MVMFQFIGKKCGLPEIGSVIVGASAGAVVIERRGAHTREGTGYERLQ